MAKKASISSPAKPKFSLDAYKKSIKLTQAQYKKDKFVVLDEYLQEVMKIPGLPLGHIVFDYGLSDSGKTTLMAHAVAQCQKQGILPVIILTGPEKKVDWNRFRAMGVEYTGDLPNNQQNADEFIIVNEECEFLEDAFNFMNDIITQVENGALPYDVYFFHDSIGNTQSEQAVEIDKKTGKRVVKDIHMKNAKIIGEQLISIAPRIQNSRKDTREHFVGAYFITSMYQGLAAFPGAPVPWKIKGGNKPKFVSSIMIKHTAGKKLNAIKNGAKLNFGMTTKISITKNHINGEEYEGEFVITKDAILPNEKGAIDEYKKNRSSEWGSFDIVDSGGQLHEGADSFGIGITTDREELEAE
jgi:RecA/RadA recombinase